MRRMLVLTLILALITGFAYWRIRLGHDPGLLEASTGMETEPRGEKSRPTASTSGLMVASNVILTRPASQAVLTPKAIFLASCHVLSASEIEIASQVDGTLHELHVQPGQQVRVGESLGKLDDRPLLPQIDLLKIRAQSKAAERIAMTQYEEALAKFEAGRESNRNGVNAVPALELQSYALQVKRFEQEILKAKEDRQAAEKELEKAIVHWDYHKLVSGMEGEVVKVFKRKGETVRQAESLFRIADHRKLTIEGLCRASQASQLRVGMKAVVEPEIRTEAWAQLSGHTNAIQWVAISPDGKLLASGSDDRTVMLWSWPEGQRLGVLSVPSEVTCVGLAKLPTDGSYMLVAGSADGLLRVWTIPGEGKIPEAMLLPKMHDGPVRSLVLSGDGSRCISGGEDRRIGEWDLQEKKHLRWVKVGADA